MNCIAVWRINVNNYSNIIKKLTSEEKASSMITNAFKELIPQKKNDYIIGLVILSFSIRGWISNCVNANNTHKEIWRY